MNEESRMSAFQIEYDNRSDEEQEEREKIMDEAVEVLEEMLAALDAIVVLCQEKEK